METGRNKLRDLTGFLSRVVPPEALGCNPTRQRQMALLDEFFQFSSAQTPKLSPGNIKI
jgi:hypothetical protein